MKTDGNSLGSLCFFNCVGLKNFMCFASFLVKGLENGVRLEVYYKCPVNARQCTVSRNLEEVLHKNGYKFNNSTKNI
jgi:hypothetical protein